MALGISKECVECSHPVLARATVSLSSAVWRRARLTEIRLYVGSYSDGDPDERAQLAGRLQEELRDLDVDDIWQPAARPPVGAKGPALEWTQLVVSLAGSLLALMLTLRRWLGRHPGASITVKIDGDRLTLSDAWASKRRQLIDAWMGRHGG
jgi:hypothetical protein